MKYQLYYESNIQRWDEAIPLGNGLIGALIWGGAETLPLSVDRTDIWHTTLYGSGGVLLFTSGEIGKGGRYEGDSGVVRCTV